MLYERRSSAAASIPAVLKLQTTGRVTGTLCRGQTRLRKCAGTAAVMTQESPFGGLPVNGEFPRGRNRRLFGSQSRRSSGVRSGDEMSAP